METIGKERKETSPPNIRFMFPGINRKHVFGCLELPMVQAFKGLSQVRAELERKRKALEQDGAKSNHPSVKYFRNVDRKLERIQGTLLTLLHESKEAAGKYSNVAIDAAIVVATAGARI